MEMKKAKLYVAPDAAAYCKMIQTITSADLNVRMQADRENLTIAVECDENDENTSVSLTDVIEANEIELTGSNMIFIPTDNSIIDEIAQTKETLEKAVANMKELREEHEEVVKQRDMYKRWFDTSATTSRRVKEQVKAIAVMINSIYPER